MKSQRPSLSSESRIAATAAEPQAYVFGPFRLVPAERMLRRGERILPLPPKAFETLLLLVRNPGHLLRKEELMTALWPDSFVEEGSLASKISLLRQVLEDAGAAAACIQTVPKQGYRFLTPVSRIWASATSAESPAQAREEAPEEPAIRFIALPFRMENVGEQLGFLEHSLPEAISASLAGLRALTVRSSLLAASLAEKRLDPKEIAREADVDMLLSGAIRCEGGHLRVSAELTHAPSSTLVGTYACEVKRDNLIEVQESLVRRVVELLVPRLSERESRALAHDVPASAQAYEFYLRANQVQRRSTFETLSMARDLYRECLEADPAYAPAWARLGRCYRCLEKFGDEGSQTMELARWAFRRAFALSPDLPVAHNLYTSMEADSGHAQAAMVRLLGQAGKHPNDPNLFAGLVQACRYCGLLEESIRAHHRARRLDPKIGTSVAFTFFLRADYRQALEYYGQGFHFYLDLAALAALGRLAEAAELLSQRSYSHEKWPEMDALGLSLGGDRAGSVAIVRHALSLPTPDPEAKFLLSRQLAYDGEPAETLRTIRHLASEGFVCSAALLNDPWLRPLSGLPDFEEALDEVLAREADAREGFQAAGGDSVLA